MKPSFWTPHSACQWHGHHRGKWLIPKAENKWLSDCSIRQSLQQSEKLGAKWRHWHTIHVTAGRYKRVRPLYIFLLAHSFLTAHQCRNRFWYRKPDTFVSPISGRENKCEPPKINFACFLGTIPPNMSRKKWTVPTWLLWSTCLCL